LRQIITGRNDSLTRIPGPWVRAASVTLPDSLVIRAYHAAASKVGLKPLVGSTLAAERSQHVMGLYRRSELLRVSRRTLEAIRLRIPSDTTRARFDRIFRPEGEWIVDLHDAALAWARKRAPGIGWEAAGPALRAAHWVGSDDSLRVEGLLRALYGLAVLSASDSTAFAAAKVRLSRAPPASTAAILALLNGYTEGQRWYTDALEFLLTAPWIPEGAGRSIRDYVRAEWRPWYRDELDVPLPLIESRWFGYPQAVPQYGVPSELFRHLVHTDNPRAAEWLQQNGEADLLRTLRWLPPGDTTPTLLQTGSETLRLTTVSRQSRESLNGFLEPADVIAIDPGYSPILAIGAVVHEWQHLLFRRRQLESFATALGGEHRRVVRLPGAQPHLAEGFAEWSTERILAPVTRRWPLPGLGELEKRADLIQRDSDDQHTIGYALVRALATALRDPVATTDLLLRNAEHPSRIPSEPGLRKAWSKYRDAADLMLRVPQSRMLIPEVTFTIEDGFPDVIATRILAAGAHDASR
jgi:hypothetical protein